MNDEDIAMILTEWTSQRDYLDSLLSEIEFNARSIRSQQIPFHLDVVFIPTYDGLHREQTVQYEPPRSDSSLKMTKRRRKSLRETWEYKTVGTKYHGPFVDEKVAKDIEKMQKSNRKRPRHQHQMSPKQRNKLMKNRVNRKNKRRGYHRW